MELRKAKDRRRAKPNATWYHARVAHFSRATSAVVLAGLAIASCTRASPPVRPLGDPPAPARPSATALAGERPPSEPIPEIEPADGEAGTPPGWLGVELALRSPESPGVLVRSVVPASPAEHAGLLKGDVILAIDGEAVNRPSEVVTAVSSHSAGERVAIAALRGDQERLLAATLEPLPNDESLLRKRYVDSAAPGLSNLKTVSGSVNPSLAELRGKVVVLEFWAEWCVPCRITAPLLSRWSDRYASEGLRVLGVTSDSVVVAAQAAERHGMTYPVFSDESGTTTLAYRAFALPTLFVIDRRGKVRDVMVGFSTSRLREVEGLVERLLAEN